MADEGKWPKRDGENDAASPQKQAIIIIIIITMMMIIIIMKIKRKKKIADRLPNTNVFGLAMATDS